MNLALLLVFKYTGFFAETLNSLTGASVPVTLGTAADRDFLFTFQAMSYVIDVYGGKPSAKEFWEGAALHIFFRSSSRDRLSSIMMWNWKLGSGKRTAERVAKGIRRFIAGLSKKVLIANVMALAADTLFGAEAGASAWPPPGSARYRICSRFILISADTVIWQ